MPESSEQEPTSGPAMPSGNEAVRAGGYKPMKPKPDAELYAPSEELKKKTLPKKVDLRQFMTKVEDQGQTMSCVANAVAGAYEYGVKRVTGQSTEVSRLFVYYNARWRANDQGEDAGCYVQNAIEGLQRFGSCPETLWPFKKPLILKKPNRSSYQEGTKGKVSQMRKVPVTLEAWKQALAEGNPIVFGCVLFDSFDECSEKGGVVPMPSPEDAGRATHGGHSMLCVGYSDVEQVFIVRNSWGEAWGDKGYCYMPYNYLMNPKFNDGDCWVFTPPVELDPAHRPTPPDPHRPTPSPKPQPRRNPGNLNVRPAPPLPPTVYYVLPLIEDFWFYDDAPVVNSGLGVDFVIETYEISLYESLEIDYFEEYTVEWSSVVEEEYAEYSECVTESRFESMEQYSIQEVAQEYTRETGETNFSVGSAIATIGGVAAAGMVAESLLNRGEDESAEDSDEALADDLETSDDTALAETGDSEEDADESAEDEEIADAADADEEESADGEESDEDEEADADAEAIAEDDADADAEEEDGDEEDGDEDAEDDAEEEGDEKNDDAKEDGDEADAKDEDEDSEDEEDGDDEESEEEDGDEDAEEEDDAEEGDDDEDAEEGGDDEDAEEGGDEEKEDEEE